MPPPRQLLFEHDLFRKALHTFRVMLYAERIMPRLCSRIMAVKRSNKYRLSRGPGEASGWYCTENTGLSLSAMPQFEPSKSDTWVSTAFAGKLSRSTANPWFIEVISTLPV